MDPISAVGLAASVVQLIDVTAKAVRYFNEVKDAPKERAKLAREATGLLSLLTDLRYRIEDVDSKDPWFRGVRSLGGEGGPLEEFAGAMKSLADKLKPTKGVKKLTILWPLDKKHIETLLSKIERLKTLIGLALQKDHFQLSLAMKEEVSREFEKLKLTQDAVGVQRWLAAPDPSLNHNAARKKRQPTTGEWFLNHHIFSDWKSEASPLLWLHGIPGCGKTILCSTIIQTVMDDFGSEPNIAVVYFYFDFNDSSKQRTGNFICSLISQFVAQCPEIPEPLLSIYSRSQSGQQQPNTEELKSVFRQVIETFRATYLMVDALDECTDREDLLGLIEEVMTWNASGLHILATSRKERDIDEGLAPHLTCQMSIQNACVYADIRNYVLDRVSNDHKLRLWPAEVRKEIENVLIEGAKGMFRWVVCQIECLRKCLKLGSLQKTLHTLPKTLEDTYDRILRDIDEEYQADASKILQWLCFSTRPIKLQEMVEVLAFDIEDGPVFRPEQRLPDPLSILTICSTLVTMTIEAPGDSVPSLEEHTSDDSMPALEEEVSNPVFETRTLRLAHYSVKEYLTSERRRSTPLDRFCFASDKINSSIAKACLTYMLHVEESLDRPFAEFDKCSRVEENLNVLFYKHKRSRSAEYPLTRYAEEEWYEHYREIKSRCEQDSLMPLALRLLQSVYWQRCYGFTYSDSMLDHFSTYFTTPLILASSFGLEGIIQQLLDGGAKVDEKDKYGACALHEALLGGHEKAAWILLDNGADFNTLDHNATTPLIASCTGFGPNSSTVKETDAFKSLLRSILYRGARCNAQNRRGQTALHIAFHYYRYSFVPLLLEHGADVNMKDLEGRQVIQSASRAYPPDRALELTSLLLDHGAQCDSPGERGETALITAAGTDNAAVAELLLSKGANVNSRSHTGHTPLYHAAKEGNETMIRLLLKNGANCNDPDDEEYTPLMWAAGYGNTKAVQILLEAGANVNVFAHLGPTTLMIAAWNGFKDIVAMLLKAGADVEAKVNGKRALDLALEKGFMGIVQLLEADSLGRQVNHLPLPYSTGA